MRQLLALLLLVVAAGISNSATAFEVVLTDPFWKPLTIAVESDFSHSPQLELSNGNSIYLTGEIVTGASVTFAAFLKAHNPAPGTVVFLYSPGGDIRDGMAIGRLIRAYKLRTAVQRRAGTSGSWGLPILSEGECDSACSMAFMGGVKRYVPEGSNYGVHDANLGDAAGQPGDFELGQTLIADVTAYCTEMGVSTDFVGIMVKYYSINNEIYNMKTAEMKELNIVTDENATKWATEEFFTPGSFDLVASTLAEPYGTKEKWNQLVVSCDTVLGKRPLVNAFIAYPSSQFSPQLTVNSTGTVTDAKAVFKSVRLISEDRDGNESGPQFDVPASSIEQYLSQDGRIRLVIRPNVDMLDYISKATLLEVRLDTPFEGHEGYTLELKDEGKLISDLANTCQSS